MREGFVKTLPTMPLAAWAQERHDPALPASPPAPLYWILLALGALFLAILVPRLRRRRTPSPERPGTFGDATQGAREELERLLAEIQDLSREHIAKLDTKIRLLTQLLAECDQKKRELEALFGRATTPGMSKGEATPSPKPPHPLHEQVWALQDQGKGVFDICSATGLEKGEVELILGLRKMPR